MKSEKAKVEAEKEVNVILVADQIPKRVPIKPKKFKEYLEILKVSEAPKKVQKIVSSSGETPEKKQEQFSYSNMPKPTKNLS